LLLSWLDWGVVGLGGNIHIVPDRGIDLDSFAVRIRKSECVTESQDIRSEEAI
jgi:hypothetical protein